MLSPDVLFDAFSWLTRTSTRIFQLLSGCCGAAITAALEGLPGRERAVLLLRDVEGLSREDVAAIVGESPDAVKSRLHRARMALREQITRVMPR